MPRDPRHGWVNAGEVKLHYWDWPGCEPAVLAIHGLTSNGRGFDTIAERLRNRVIAVDLRGRGLSDKPRAGGYGWATHAGDMLALLKALGIGPVVTLGWSMGAYVAAMLASEGSDLVGRLVLIDGGGDNEDLTEDELRKQGEAPLKRLGAVYASIDAYLEHWRASAPFVRPWTEHFERYLRADVEERPDGTVASRTSLAAVDEDMVELTRWKAKEVLPLVDVPAVVLWAPEGMADPSRPLFSRASLQQAVEMMPNGRLVTIEGANHFTIGFAPDCVTQVVAAMEHLLID